MACAEGSSLARPVRRAITDPDSYIAATQLAITMTSLGLGWIGASPECDIVLGGVRGRNGVIPSPSALGRLLALIEAKEDMGAIVMLEVEK